MKHVVVGMEVSTVLISRLLGVTKLVVHAELENHPVESWLSTDTLQCVVYKPVQCCRNHSKVDAHAQLQQKKEELLWHPISWTQVQVQVQILRSLPFAATYHRYEHQKTVFRAGSGAACGRVHIPAQCTE